MIEVKASTKRGQALLERGQNCYYKSLHNIYDRWSQAKEEAYNRCFDMYMNSENRAGFGVGNANTFGFSCSWLCTIDGEDVMRLETKDNSYCIWLER